MTANFTLVRVVVSDSYRFYDSIYRRRIASSRNVACPRRGPALIARARGECRRVSGERSLA